MDSLLPILPTFEVLGEFLVLEKLVSGNANGEAAWLRVRRCARTPPEDEGKHGQEQFVADMEVVKRATDSNCVVVVLGGFLIVDGKVVLRRHMNEASTEFRYIPV